MTQRSSNFLVVSLVIAIALMLVIALPQLSFAQANGMSAASNSAGMDQSGSLYKRLGGYDALTAVTDDFIGRMAMDPKLAKFFTGLSDDSKARVKLHIVDFLCKATGGPCAYTGRDMKTSHTGLHISEDDWNLAVKHLSATFDKFNVGQRERGEVVQALVGIKGDIVGR